MSFNHSGAIIETTDTYESKWNTKETFKKTSNWIVKNKIETVTAHILTPYPGTALYRRLKDEHRILEEDLSLYNTAHVVFRPQNMTEQELLDGYLWIYRNIYSFKNIIKRMPVDRSQRAAYFMFNLFYRKWGKFTDHLRKKITYKKIGILGERLSHYL